MRTPSTMPRGKTSLWPLAAIAIVVIIASAVAWKLGYFEHEQRDRLIAAIGDVRGSWVAAGVFIGCWILAILLCLPTTVITIVGGALFGTVRGAAFSWSAALPAAPVGVVDHVAALPPFRCGPSWPRFPPTLLGPRRSRIPGRSPGLARRARPSGHPAPVNV